MPSPDGERVFSKDVDRNDDDEFTGMAVPLSTQVVEDVPIIAPITKAEIRIVTTTREIVPACFAILSAIFVSMSMKKIEAGFYSRSLSKKIYN
jgi:hypothetical protein